LNVFDQPSKPVSFGVTEAHRRVKNLLGSRNKFLCGDTLTIADYMGAVILAGGECIGEQYRAYPNIARWLGQMKSLRNWQSVNAMFYQFMVDPNKGKSFVGL